MDETPSPRRSTKSNRPILRPSRTLPRTSPPKPRAQGRLWALLIALLLITALVRLLPSTGGRDVTPAELVGNWTTGDARYEGRRLVITADSVLFLAGAEGRSGFRIKRIERRVGAMATDYVILGEVETADRLSLQLSDQTMELENPPDVFWRRSR